MGLLDLRLCGIYLDKGQLSPGVVSLIKMRHLDFIILKFLIPHIVSASVAIKS